MKLRLLYKLLPIAVCLVAAACKKVEPNPDENHDAAVRIMGTHASVAASLHVDAMRACQIAGVKDIEPCALQDGTLLPEREAKSMARMSVDQTKRYFEKCRADFSTEYCNDLIARAIEMEWRKPVSTQSTLPDER